MKPPLFEYYDPTTVAEVVELLTRLGPEAKLLAGGQSLVPALNMRLSNPSALIDLRRVTAMRYIRKEENQLCIGAMTRHADLEQSEVVAALCPLLHEAVGLVGHTAIRSRGTVGGSLAHADPAAELPTAAVALEADLMITGRHGVRHIPAREFFVNYFTTRVEPDEVLTEVRVPLLPPGTGTAFTELSRRKGDFALVGVACILRLDRSGSIDQVRLALSSVGNTPLRAAEAEELLLGQMPSVAAFAAAGDAVASVLDTESDIHAPAAYRQQLARVLVRRALQTAYARTDLARTRR